MKHRYIEIAGQSKGVVIESLDEVEKNSAEGVVAIKCTASLNTNRVITYGEASPKNNKNGYPYAMAEKRAIDRAILKLIGIHGFVYSDDEVEENFENVVVKRPEVKTEPKIDKVYITTTLEVIEKNPKKKNSKDLRAELEALKTRIFKGGNWNEFKQSPSFNKYNELVEIHKPKRS